MPLMVVKCEKCGASMWVSNQEIDKRERYVCSRKRCKE